MSDYPIEFESIEKTADRRCEHCRDALATVLIWHITDQSSGLCEQCALALAADLVSKASGCQKKGEAP